MQLDVNAKALKKYIGKFESLPKSTFPVAVRETLTDCAKDMKMNTLLSSAKSSFVERQPNFFKANSAYERAMGFRINDMKATVGMIESRLKGGNNYSVKDLEAQEEGGEIEKKSFIPMNEARANKNPNKLVRPNARLKSIKNIVNVRNVKGVNKGQRFLKAAMKAGNGGYVLGSIDKGESVLWKINSVHSSLKDKSLVVKAKPLYDYSKNRSITVKPKKFIEKAGNESHSKIDNFFIKRADRAFEKHLR